MFNISTSFRYNQQNRMLKTVKKIQSLGNAQWAKKCMILPTFFLAEIG